MTTIPDHPNCKMAPPLSEEESIKLGERYLLEHRLVDTGIAFHPCRRAREEYLKIAACTHRWYGPLEPDNECKDCGVTYSRFWAIKMHNERLEEEKRRAEGKSVAGMNPGMKLD